MGLLRLLLALGVTVAHFDGVVGAQFILAGQTRMRLFYIISGFYMALVLKEKYTGPGSGWRFFGSRCLRLLPTYYLLLALPVVVTVMGRLITGQPVAFGSLNLWSEHAHHLEPWAALVVAVSNVTVIGQELSWAGGFEAGTGRWVFSDDYFAPGMIPGFSFLVNPPTWTMALELEFYCLAPWLMAWRTSRLLALGGGSLACGMVLPWAFPSLAGLSEYHFLPSKLVYFLAGALCYRVFAHQRDSGRLPDMVAGGRFAWPVLVGLFFAYPHMAVGPREVLIVLALAAALPFVFALTAKMKADRALGDLSYPLYLVHWNLACVWSLLVRKGWLPDFSRNWLDVAAYVSVCLLAAVILARVVEAPVNRYRNRRFARSGTATPEPSPGASVACLPR